MSEADDAPAREQVPVGGPESTLAASEQPVEASAPRRITGAAPGARPFRARTYGDAAVEAQAEGFSDGLEPERAARAADSPTGGPQVAPAAERVEPSGVIVEATSEEERTVDPLETTSASEAMASAPPGSFEAEASSANASLPGADLGGEPRPAIDTPPAMEPPTTMEPTPASEPTPPTGESPIATPSASQPPSYATQPPLQTPVVTPRPAAPPAHLTAAPPPSEQARSELRRRRDALAEEVTELHWDLGGLAYEMAIRDHFRLDVLVRRAAVLQERDAELAELERLLQMEEGGIAGSCPNCGAPHSRGAVYCWQCGAALMQRAQSSVLPEADGATAVMDRLRPPGATGSEPASGADNRSDG